MAVLTKLFGKVVPKAWGFAVKRVLRRESVVTILRRLGYTGHADETGVHYTHALVVRKRKGARPPALEILRDHEVRDTFCESWPSDFSVFVDKVRRASLDLVAGDDIRHQAIDMQQEARLFWEEFQHVVDEIRSLSTQETHELVANVNRTLGSRDGAGLAREIHDIHEEVMAGKKRAPQRKAESQLLEDYLKDVKAATYRIDIKGIYSDSGAGREPAYFPIEQHYTPLKTASRMSGPEELAATERIPLTDLLSGNRRLLIIGEPGSGKTTFLRLIACVLAKDRLGEGPPLREAHLGLALTDEPPIPVMVRISALAALLRADEGSTDTGGTWIKLVRVLEKQWKTEKANMLQRQLDAGRCALLLDGLDEVADPILRQRIAAVVNAILEHWGRNLVVITSRSFGYRSVESLEGMASAHIDAFGKEEMLQFVERWVCAIYPDEEDRNRNAYLPELRSAILNVHDIRRMARNPVMLTCLCVVHWNESKLPAGKADLLKAVLRWLLNAKEYKRQERNCNNTFAEECFKALALAMTTRSEGKQADADLCWAAETLARPFLDELDISGNSLRCEGQRFLEAEMLDSGIVIQDGVGQLRFWHYTFQEHYAARALVDLADREDEGGWWQVVAEHLDDPQWSEVIDHFAGCLAKTGRRRLHLLTERILAGVPEDDLAATARVVGIFGRLLGILEVYDYQPPQRLRWEDMRERVMAIFTLVGAGKVPAADRIRAAEALGQGGDERFRSVEPEMLSIPGHEGVVLGKHPVTVREYERFVDSDGYSDPSFWGEWWDLKEKEGWEAPDDWDDQLEHRSRPVTGISWCEARAYCKWLSIYSKKPYRLPASDEWEAAATTSAGEYPWGKEEPSEELANFEMNVGAPTPVGVYPAGAAPGGHLDMAGNVWEWCEDKAGKKGSHRVLRGGSWDASAGSCRSAFRTYFPPDYRYGSIGFRLSRSLP